MDISSYLKIYGKIKKTRSNDTLASESLDHTFLSFIKVYYIRFCGQ